MEEKNTYYIPFFVPVLLLIVVLFGALIFLQKGPSPTASKFDSQFSLSPTSGVLGTSYEPVVLRWVPYQNTQYTFSLEIPDKWQQQDYASFYAQGGTQIAFSPDELPCKTCSYFQDGFFSIRIYNEKTDPQSYARFAQLVKAMGKAKELVPVQLGGQKGLMYQNTIAVEYKGWVYEFVLDKDKGSLQAQDSKIFQRVASSLEFTDLRFVP